MSYTFTPEAVSRIRAAVRKVEQTPAALRHERTASIEPGTEFPAMLLSGDAAGRYTIVRVRPDVAGLDPHAFVPVDGDGIRWSMDDNAEVHVDAGREANNNRSVPLPTVVKVTFCGYDQTGSPVFLFYYPRTEQAGGLPVHDHRDNLNGGFAFSVFHPGTSIPQHQYAL